ncbi:hypothetical protein [Actinomadura bangladeshensis]|jgi:hypothetical protein|uniref:Uncharacterized protein n=1 Tax=Actinomadura bangladeshensis TaxID=453573 RepID=A0A6L9QNR0_9ACTN|nr:hypothetical protein [Actinomadura bangladeshensis]NEA27129.1 hypothetical protein [Actinomadura bangladeshensis]
MGEAQNNFGNFAILPGLGACLVALILFTLIAVVIVPAVWSRTPERREAALVVLRLLLRHLSERRAARPKRGSSPARRRR